MSPMQETFFGLKKALPPNEASPSPSQKPSGSKKNAFSDLDLNHWRDYKGDITTDALWVESKKKDDGKFLIPKRDFLPKNSSTFHGLFIPEIPYQFILRFTKKGETVWDCFGGSGTTYRVAKLLKRNCIINDLTPTESFITPGDSRTFSPAAKVQLLFMHPPYHNIVQFSTKESDGSYCKSMDDFLDWFEKVVANCVQYLDTNRFLILVCGNLYLGGEEHTLGVWCKDIIRKYHFKCKSHIIKDYGETKGGNKNYNIQYYRQLRGHFNNFYGDNIFILQKAG